MLVKRYMQTKVIMVGLDERANAALYMMKKKGIRHLLVTDNSKLRGIVTDRDFRLMRPSPATSLSIYEVHYLLDKLKVKEIMTKKVITVTPETTIAEAAHLLLNRRIGALPVLKDEKVVGIITETDMIRALIDLEEAQGT
ncbi:CBS domain-containing protein [Candidatus Methylomirabilis limnetica]|jgi:acetoin utilization protein AcuB|nr:CBS domain-containing protein [Candidatus Methylomirabilis limnetica]